MIPLAHLHPGPAQPRDALLVAVEDDRCTDVGTHRLLRTLSSGSGITYRGVCVHSVVNSFAHLMFNLCLLNVSCAG